MRQSLRLFAYLFENAPVVVVLMTVCGVLSGLFSVGVIAIITRTLYQSDDATVLLGLAFVGLLVGKILTAAVANVMLTRFTQGTVLELSLTLARRILDAPLRILERRGGGRILTTLTDDVSNVTWSVQCIPRLAVSAAVVAGCGLYMAWLSLRLFALACVVILAGTFVVRLLNRRAYAVVSAAREARTQLFDLYRAVIDGVKELKMHRARRVEFVDVELQAAADACRRTNLEANDHQVEVDSFSQLMLFGLIGVLLFVAYPATGASKEDLTGYVLTMIYMMNPLWTIIGTVPVVMRGQAALAAIEDLGISLTEQAERPDAPSSPVGGASDDISIELRDVVFRYESADPAMPTFGVGPVDFSVRSGEIVFVVGGNGSGKSTFLRLLCGLYPVESGEVLVNGKHSGSGDAAYRELFSVLFPDFFLFRKLLGIRAPDLPATARSYLHRLGLDAKVTFEDREFSTTNLSQGQRKRLALVTAYLEDRPVYVFDEWAADQDQEYKRIFYRQLLPELRSRGKAVVVTTHDDRYFDVADCVVALEDGRVSKRSQAHGTTVAERAGFTAQ